VDESSTSEGYDLRRLAHKGFVRRVPASCATAWRPADGARRCSSPKSTRLSCARGPQALDTTVTAHVPPPLRRAFDALDAATDASSSRSRLPP